MKDVLKLIGGILVAIIAWLMVFSVLVVVLILFAKAIDADVENIYRFIGSCTISWIAFYICDKVADRINFNSKHKEK